MKIISRLLFVFILLAATGYSSIAAGYTAEKSQKRNVKGFSGIEVSTGIQLYLSMENEESVRVEAPENMIHDVITEVDNGILKIYIKNRTGFKLFNLVNSSSVKAYVSAMDLNRLNASSGSKIKAENTLKGNRLNMNASSGSQVDIDLEYQDVVVDASSGSHLNFKGLAKRFKATTSSGSSVSAWDLVTEHCQANASSGGNISVHVKDELSAKASSGGNIRYTGNPSAKDVDRSSGGTVSSR